MTQARQVVARTCLVQTCCPAATIAAGGGNGVWHGAGKLASLPSLSFPFLLFRLLLALCCVLHLLLLPPLVLLLFIPIVSSPEPTCITLAVFQHDSLRVSLAASSAPHHVFRLFAAIPIPVPPPLPAVFRLHLQPLWLRHRRGRRARHRCRRSNGPEFWTGAQQVRHATGCCAAGVCVV